MMSLKSEDQRVPAPTVESKDDSQIQYKFKYSRDFLLSFSDLDICRRLPAGFEESILSEFEDASHSISDRQRAPGGLSLQRYTSTSLNRVDSSSNYSRGSHGRWDTRSSGSNDRDGDSLSDRDSVVQDSGRRYGNSRRTWQQPEHDGLLGSGAFPRPSGYTGSASAPRGRANEHYQLNRSSEPYHPPRFYKAPPHSRQDTDSRNDETFGSAECSTEDRVEEERKRRESFELMRKEQQKEKQKHPDKHKGQLDIDLVALLKNSEEESLQNKSDDRSGDHLASVSQSDSVKCYFPAQAPASRPLVPPGFGGTVLEKNLGAKSLVLNPAPEVGNIGSIDAHGKSNGSDDDCYTEKQSAACMHAYEHKCETRNAGVPFIDANEKNLLSSAGAEASSCSFSFENPTYESSSLLQAGEGCVDSADANFESDMVTRLEVGSVGQVQSTSILEKLFNNALAVNGVGSPSFVEHNDVKSDGDKWSAQLSQASKFAHWFLDEETKLVDDVSSSKARDLLSLIVSHDSAGPSTVSNEKADGNILRIFPFESTEVAQNLITATATASTTVGVLEPFNHSDNADASSAVLTCEDLEQSILAEAEGSGSIVQHAWNFLDAKVEMQKAAVDDHASQHLLSLLQKGTSSKGLAMSPPKLDAASFDSPKLDAASFDTLGVPDSLIGTGENVHGTEKTLTLETLFGTAFMNELHSVEAPVSIHRGSSTGVAKTDAPEHHGLPFSDADDGLFHSRVSEHLSHKPNAIEVPQPNKIEEHWLSFNDPRLKGLKFELDGSFEGKADRVPDVQLPEEESLIAVGNPLHHETSQFMPMHVGNAARVSSEPLAEIVDKLAALNSILKDERPVVPGLERPPVFHGPYEPLEAVGPYQRLHNRPPQFPHHINNARPPFNPLEQHALGPDRFHQDPQRAFPPNIVPHHFNGLGGPRFDPVNSPMQHMHRPENFIPPHLLHGIPRGVPLPLPLNNLPGYIPEVNLMQGFPLNHQQGNYGGNGLGMPGSGIVGGNHPEMLERLIEMELRGKQKQVPPVAAGHGPGFHGSELDMAFRYR